MRYIEGTIKTKPYQAWVNMRRRCSGKKFLRWGGRGISVCLEWSTFEKFYEDMGDPPSNEYSLDRIDNDGNYEKENCRWATISEQINNRNRFKRINKTGYLGVYLNRTGKGYQVQIERKNVGSFKTKEEAALAYNQKAIELYGDKAILNEV